MSTAIARRQLRSIRGLGQEGTASSSPLPTDIRSLPLHLYPPKDFENLDRFGYVGLPAIGAEATILDFTVPDGRNGMIVGVACNFIGGGWVEGSGLVVWRIQVDQGPVPGASDYNNILGSLGSPANPVRIAGFRVYEHQRVTFVCDNVAPGVVLAGQLVGARLLGWTYPREYEDQEIWL